MSKFYLHLYNILFLAVFLSITACSVRLQQYTDDTSAINYDINKKVAEDTKISNGKEQMHKKQKNNKKKDKKNDKNNKKRQKNLFEFGIEIGDAILLFLLHI